MASLYQLNCCYCTYTASITRKIITLKIFSEIIRNTNAFTLSAKCIFSLIVNVKGSELWDGFLFFTPD